ncbi:zona pellucida-binding protein 2 isoform X2 [Dendropsophus ebraccatus]|uniref:zona pellucida-binding protein 2 isoform X2 n=1 Tax=Dendropsophus ebraccatus TaxID=150705 RepID=UPI003831C43E
MTMRRERPENAKSPVFGINVYVKMMEDSPPLTCMDVVTASELMVDPFFSWMGPDGKYLEGQSNVILTETGKLTLKAFDKSMSGTYTCMMFHKLVESDVTQEKEIYKSYEFGVFAYLEPDYMYQISVKYTAKPCKEIANAKFVSVLFSIIEEIITNQSCHLENPYHKCHTINALKDSLQNQLFIAFRVNPFSSGRNKKCSSNSYGCQEETSLRLEKAKHLIMEFFRMQRRMLEELFVNIPEIRYIERSLDIIHVDSCRPGFGKNQATHQECVGCCVVCDPGTYSSDKSTHCEVCKDIRITYYGATEC